MAMDLSMEITLLAGFYLARLPTAFRKLRKAGRKACVIPPEI